MRPAIRTGNWLGVEAPVKGVRIFCQAGRAHFELPHRGFWPVIRNICDDGEAGAAVGAVNEGITVAPVMRVEQFCQAIRADADVRGNGDKITRFALRVHDLESLEPVYWDPIYLEGIDA